MSTLLQVSDPHFGTERPEVLDALSALALRERPDVLVLSGDITQRARRHQFDAARRFVDRLDIAHVVAVPGNHDIPLFNLWARLHAPYRGWRRAFGELEPAHDGDDLLVLAVNTTRWWRHQHGEISHAQVDRVAQALRRARPRQLRVVVTHQPVHVIEPIDERHLVRGHREAIARWSDAGVDLVLGGHIHLAHVRPLAERLPGARGWTVLAGTAVSQRVRGGRANSVNLVRWRDGLCRIERWDHAGGRGFVLAAAQALPLDRASGR